MTIDNDDGRPDRRSNSFYGLLLTIAFGLPLITPLLRWSAVACTHDGHLHYHRVAAMAHAWANSIYFSRWLPDLAFGYGYPFFVYREAAPLYIVLLPFLAGLPLPAASNLFYAVTILAAGMFMFLWVRDLFGPRSALVSAVAYMAAPYLLVDALVRGNAPESLALPLFPLLLWSGRRWALFRSGRSFIIGTLGLAFLSISHNISLFIFTPTLLVYLLVIVWGKGKEGAFSQSRAISRVLALITLGLGLAFFYTGGALLEMNEVTLEMSTTTRNNDWRLNFATLGEILAPVAAEDPTLVNPPLLFRLGWVPLLLAAIGVTGLAWIKGRTSRAREQRLHIGLMAAGFALYLFMALPASRALWEALPLIDFVQFPWRFVGRAALPIAFLAGVPFYWFAPQRCGELRSRTSRLASGWWPAALTAAAASLLIIEAIPNLYPRYCFEDPFPTIRTVHEYEHITGLVGVDPEGSYFPRTVRQRPIGSPLETDYAAGRTPQRFDRSALPVGAEIRDITYKRLGVTLTVDSAVPFTARYLSFAFPGWRVVIDGKSVTITPEDPSGLITFDVPAGVHTVSVGWGTTPLRSILLGLSALSLLGIAAIAVPAIRQNRSQKIPLNHGLHLTGKEMIALGLVAIGLLGLKFISDNTANPLNQPGDPAKTHPTTLQAAELRLAGFNLSRERVPAGETFDVDLAWTAVAPPVVDYQSEITLLDPDGLTWSRKGTERPRTYEDMPPTRQWAAGEWGWDSREVATLTGTPPGTYDIAVTLFDKATLAPVTFIDTSFGQAVGPGAVIGQIEIVNPAAAPKFDPQYPDDHSLPGSGLRLLGYNQDRAEAMAGEAVLLTFFWECDAPADCADFPLSLRNEAGGAVQTWTLPAVREGFPADAWPGHGRLRGQHIVQLPAALESGRYRFSLGDFPLGEIAVTAPERTFTQPKLAQSIDAAFATAGGAPVATLVGLAVDSSSSPCSPAPLLPCALPLVWRVDGESTVSYHVFVHLVDEAGNILAQSDAVPARWTRPTTGWLPEEYVMDTHTLTLPSGLPPGQLFFRVGLYDPVTGERLLTRDGTDAVLVTLP